MEKKILDLNIIALCSAIATVIKHNVSSGNGNYV